MNRCLVALRALIAPAGLSLALACATLVFSSAVDLARAGVLKRAWGEEFGATW